MFDLDTVSFGGYEVDTRFLILLLIFFSLSLFFVFNGFLEWDEGSFMLNAEYFSGQGENFEESRPAALSMIIAGVWFITGESTIAARLLVLGFGLAASTVFYLIARDEFDEPLLPSAAFLLSPLMIYWSSRVYTDVPAMLFVLGAFYAYRKKRFFAAGALMSIAATFRYLFLIFALGMALAFIKENRERFRDYVAGGIAGAVPFLSYSWIGYGSPFSRIRMYVTRVSRWSDSGAFAALVPNLLSAFSMLSGLLPLVAIGWRDARLIEKTMIASYTVFMLLFSGNSFTRYWLAVLPFVILVAHRGSGKKLFAAGAAVMILFSGSVVLEEYQANNKCTEPLEDAIDYVSTLEGGVVSDSWAITGYLLDRPVSSPWTDMDTLHTEYDYRYAVFRDELDGYPVVREFGGENCGAYRVYNLSAAEQQLD